MNSNLEQYIQMSDNNEVGGSGIDLRAGQSTVPVDLMCSFGVADFQYFPTQRYNELIKLYFLRYGICQN
ncbi:hypothetical protein [Chromobacterium vaccinii]|uniref:hypothetical protein n=1 Tax=Chromobacterium vaccinii TaxID=1108595 RepID=UPI0011C0405D|nr:hypothetical protein [Chromobacterium vaccinii]